MLCDEILADPYLPKMYPSFNAQQMLLRGAQKFVLAPDFTAAADGLVDNYKELERILPFCRIPFPVCWMEWAQADRPHFKDATTQFPEMQSAPRRIGVLMHVRKPLTKPELWNWITTLMWSLRELPVGVSPTLLNASSIIVEFDTKNKLDKRTGYGDGLIGEHVRVFTANFCPPEVAELINQGGNAMAQVLASDWGGEIRFLIAALGLFNARNVMETETVNNDAFNRKRAKAGKLPLASHTLLKIRPHHRRSLVGVRGKGTAADIRKHFVSGHWKARKTGLFFWNPHWRGQGKGIVTHDYEIT